MQNILPCAEAAHENSAGTLDISGGQKLIPRTLFQFPAHYLIAEHYLFPNIIIISGRP